MQISATGLCIFTVILTVNFAAESAGDGTPKFGRPISTDTLARLKERIIAARRARYVRRHRQHILSNRVNLKRNSSEAINCPSDCFCRNNELDCSSRRLKNIPQGIPSGVTKLNLGMNKIASVRQLATSNFSATLQYLYLYSNEITSLGNGNFADLKKLVFLRLSHNQIEEIRKSALHGIENLDRLHLDYNNISFIHPLAFRGLTKLRFLQLEGNKLSMIHQDLFVTIEFQKYFKFSGVHNLYLSKNSFSHLPRHVFDHLTELKYVYLFGNPWDCSCESKWLKQWMEDSGKNKCRRNPTTSPGSPGECAICSSPSMMSGRLMKDVSSSSFKCSETRLDGTETAANFSLDSISNQNDAVLFRSSGFYTTILDLQLYSDRRSVLLAKCNLTKIPVTTVSDENHKVPGEVFSASFESIFQCFPEYPSSSEALTELFRPYSGRNISLNHREIGVSNPGKNTERYSMQSGVSDESVSVPLTEASITSTSTFILSNSSIISFLADGINSELNTFLLNFRTSFSHEYSPKVAKFSKRPWLLIKEPDTSTVEVVLQQDEKPLTAKCRAIGQPKPNIAWALPSGATMLSGERNGRHAVNKAGRLFIKRSSPQDSGFYRCIATSPDKTDSQSSSLAEISVTKIKVFPATQGDFSVTDISPETPQEYVEEGTTWTSQCHIESLYDATTGWITPDNQLLVGTSRDQHGQVYSYDNGSIVIQNFQKENGGLYRCVGVNVAGEEQYSVYVSLPIVEEDIIETMVIDVAPSETQDYSDSKDDIIIPGDELPSLDIIGSSKNSPDERSTTLDGIDMNDGYVPVVNIEIDEEDLGIDEISPDDSLDERIIDSVPSTKRNATNSRRERKEANKDHSSSIDNELDKLLDENSKDLTYDDGELLIPSIQILLENDTSREMVDTENPDLNPMVEDEIEIGADIDEEYYDENYPEQQTQNLTISTKPVVPENNTKNPLDQKPSLAPTDKSPMTEADSSTSKYANFFKTPTSFVRKPVIIKTTYRTHHGEEEFLLPTVESDITTQPNSPKFMDTSAPSRHAINSNEQMTFQPSVQDNLNRFDVISGANKTEMGSTVGGLIKYPDIQTRQHQDVTTPFQLHGELLGLKAEPDGTSEFDHQRNPESIFKPELQLIDPSPLAPFASGKRQEGGRKHPNIGDDIDGDQHDDKEPLPPVLNHVLNGKQSPSNESEVDTSKNFKVSEDSMVLSSFVEVKNPHQKVINGHKPSSHEFDVETTRIIQVPATKETTPTTVSSKTTKKLETTATTTSKPDDVIATSKDSATTKSDDKNARFDVAPSSAITTSASIIDDDVNKDQSSVNQGVIVEVLEVPAGKISKDSPPYRKDSNTIFGRERGKVLLPCMPIDVKYTKRMWTFTWTLPNGDVYSRPNKVSSRDWTKFVHRNGSLLVTSIKPEDKGRYSCIAVDDENNVEYHTNADLIVLERLRIHNPSREHIKVKPGSELMIPCNATGSPHPTISWETPWGAKLFYSTYVNNLEVLWNGTLRIFKVRPEERGSYRCVATNGNEIKSRSVAVSMMSYAPLFVSSSRGTKYVSSGSTITLQCEATGYPKPSIYWMLPRDGNIRQNQARFSGSMKIPKYRVTKEGNLHITRVSSRNTGLYHCVISNYLGRSASMLKLIVV